MICLSGLLTLGNAQDQQVRLERISSFSEHENLSEALVGDRQIAIASPPPGTVRAMAEWEEVSCLLLSWTQYPHCLREIVRHARRHCEVVILCEDSLSVRRFLLMGGVSLRNVAFVHAHPNSVWIRDYGPQTVYTEGGQAPMLVDWIYNRPRQRDDHLSEVIANAMGLPLYATTAPPYALVNTGGNVLVDGMGTAFSTQLVVKENGAGGVYVRTPKGEDAIDAIMQRYMGIHTYVKLPMLPYDRIHHIDMHLKLLDEETLLVGQYPPGIADGPQIEENLNYLQRRFRSAFGEPYRVLRIPMPSDHGQYPDVRSAQYRTYTNSVFINELVLVPQYGCAEDQEALRVYREHFPGYEVVGIDVRELIRSGGALHCVTLTVGARDPLRMVHQPLRERQLDEDGTEIQALVQHASGVKWVEVWFSQDLNKRFRSLRMHRVGGTQDQWQARLPRLQKGVPLYYFLRAKAESGKVQTRPMSGARGSWKVEWGAVSY